MGGRRVASAEDFARSAADLATVPPPKNLEAAKNTQWLPLGTFVLSTNEKEADSSRMIQLAVSKDGIISGTYYDEKTDKAQPIQGRVDKETQRVAFRIGNDDQTVYEAGLFNLTHNEVPLLVHSGVNEADLNLLVRLEKPQGEVMQASAESTAAFLHIQDPEQKARSRFDLAMMLVKGGKLEKARQWCTEIIAQYPDTRAARDAQAYLKKVAE
jgi:hypothetical protein